MYNRHLFLMSLASFAECFTHARVSELGLSTDLFRSFFSIEVYVGKLFLLGVNNCSGDHSEMAELKVEGLGWWWVEPCWDGAFPASSVPSLGLFELCTKHSIYVIFYFAKMSINPDRDTRTADVNAKIDTD